MRDMNSELLTNYSSTILVPLMESKLGNDGVFEEFSAEDREAFVSGT
jgi:hypothetical protein